MPIYEIKEVSEEVRTDELRSDNFYYYKESQTLRELYDDRYYEGIDQNWLIENIIDNNRSDETIQAAIIGCAKMMAKIQPQKNKYSDLWLITLTSKDEWDEIEAKAKIDKYRESHFKKYKYIWVEEHGGESGKYHQHILVESKNRFHTGINLKPSKYYDANINVERVKNGMNDKANVIKYMTKENKPQGNLQYFMSS